MRWSHFAKGIVGWASRACHSLSLHFVILILIIFSYRLLLDLLFHRRVITLACAHPRVASSLFMAIFFFSMIPGHYILNIFMFLSTFFFSLSFPSTFPNLCIMSRLLPFLPHSCRRSYPFVLFPPRLLVSSTPRVHPIHIAIPFPQHFSLLHLYLAVFVSLSPAVL